jgi:putative ABC transport system permease protein
MRAHAPRQVHRLLLAARMLGKDLRSAAASLSRAPVFTLTAIAILALGIGANTAIFSVVHGVLIRPLPFPEPDRIVRIWSSAEDRHLPFFSVSLPDFEDWRTRTRSIARFAAYERARAVKLHGDLDQVATARVSVDLFPLLGVAPVFGRPLVAADTAETGPGAVLISHSLWRRRYGGQSAALGGTLMFDDRAWTVVGVMPPQFELPNTAADVWIPLPMRVDWTQRSKRFLRVLGRLRHGHDIEDARRELAQIAAQLARDHPDSNSKWGVNVRPLIDTVVSREFRRSLALLAGGAAFVLLLACANVTGLLLSRATARRREMAVRTALGASRPALMRMLLLENLLLAMAAGLLGVLLAMWGVDVLKTIGTQSIPRLEEIAVSGPVLAFASLVTLLTVGLFGLAPALNASSHVADNLRSRDASADARATRSRSALIVGEVAVGVVLLVGAGLMVQSFVRLQQRPLGFNPKPLLIVDLSDTGDPVNPRGSTVLITGILARMAALPGVVAAAGASSLPFVGPNAGNLFHIEGRPAGKVDIDTDFRVVTPDYFRTLGIPVVRGRPFSDGDGPGAPVAIISASTAARHWEGRTPIGARVRLGDSPWMTVVGVAADVRYQALDEPGDAVRPMMYVPHRQMPAAVLDIALKTVPSPETMTDTVRRTLRAAIQDVAVVRIETMQTVLARARSEQRFTTTLVTLFAWTAALLSAAGVYGLVAYVVSRRCKEIALRVVLGAQAIDIVRVTAGRGLLLGAIGVGLGVLASVGLSGLLRGVLFEVSPTDPGTYAAVASLALAITVAASYLPARRALRINPVEALRLD